MAAAISHQSPPPIDLAPIADCINKLKPPVPRHLIEVLNKIVLDPKLKPAVKINQLKHIVGREIRVLKGKLPAVNLRSLPKTLHGGNYSFRIAYRTDAEAQKIIGAVSEYLDCLYSDFLTFEGHTDRLEGLSFLLNGPPEVFPSKEEVEKFRACFEERSIEALNKSTLASGTGVVEFQSGTLPFFSILDKVGLSAIEFTHFPSQITRITQYKTLIQVDL